MIPMVRYDEELDKLKGVKIESCVVEGEVRPLPRLCSCKVGRNWESHIERAELLHPQAAQCRMFKEALNPPTTG